MLSEETIRGGGLYSAFFYIFLNTTYLIFRSETENDCNKHKERNMKVFIQILNKVASNRN